MRCCSCHTFCLSVEMWNARFRVLTHRFVSTCLIQLACASYSLRINSFTLPSVSQTCSQCRHVFSVTYCCSCGEKVSQHPTLWRQCGICKNKFWLQTGWIVGRHMKNMWHLFEILNSLIFVFLEGGAVYYIFFFFVVMRHPGEITLKINSDVIV